MESWQLYQEHKRLFFINAAGAERDGSLELFHFFFKVGDSGPKYTDKKLTVGNLIEVEITLIQVMV